METGVSYSKLDPDTDERFLSLRRELGVTTFGINQILLRPGQRGRIHRHFHQEEVYLVLAGTLTLGVEGEERELHAGRDRPRRARGAPPARQPRADADCLLLALGGAIEHVGRDGEAYESWDAETGAPPQEVPLPSDL